MTPIPFEPVVERIDEIPINPQLFYFLGVMRDGTLPIVYDGHYEISVAQKNPEFLKMVKTIFIETLKINENKIRIKIDKNTPRIVVYNKKLYSFLKELKVGDGDVEPIVFKYPQFWKWYVRGFFDAEGEIAHVEKYLAGITKTFPQPRILIHQASKNEKECKALVELKKIIESLGVKCGNILGPKRNVNTYDFDLMIYGIKNVENFYSLIGTSHIEKNLRFNLLLKLYSQ